MKYWYFTARIIYESTLDETVEEDEIFQMDVSCLFSSTTNKSNIFPLKRAKECLIEMLKQQRLGDHTDKELNYVKLFQVLNQFEISKDDYKYFMHQFDEGKDHGAIVELDLGLKQNLLFYVNFNYPQLQIPPV